MAVEFRFKCVSGTETKEVEVLGTLETEPVTPGQLREFASMVRGRNVDRKSVV